MQDCRSSRIMNEDLGDSRVIQYVSGLGFLQGSTEKHLHEALKLKFMLQRGVQEIGNSRNFM